jgi:hypothetical protein
MIWAFCKPMEGWVRGLSSREVNMVNMLQGVTIYFFCKGATGSSLS